MKFPEDIQVILARRYQNKHCDWLNNLIKDQWPLELPLSIPTEQEALRQPEKVRCWVAAWQAWRGVGTLIWSERHWKHLGLQRLPDKLYYATPEDVAKKVGEGTSWQQACIRYQKLVTHWPALKSKLQRFFSVLAHYNETDFQCLFQMLEWIRANPDSNLYSRQLPIAGIDSKWLETRKKLLSDLISIMQNDTVKAVNSKDFFKLCGLRPLPYLVRLRVLDSGLREHLGGLGDVTVPVEDLAALNFSPSRIFIVENLQTGLAFTDMPSSVVLMGLGYSVEILARIPWLAKAQCFYWGDLDTHGFAILHRARSYLPQLQSVLMDENTLLAHNELWVQEKMQHSSTSLSRLSEAEQALYQGLKQQSWGQNVRLEQERIDWNYAMQVLKFV